VIPAGAIDFHVHAAPSLWERRHDVPTLLERVRDSPLGGVVLKSHFGNTFEAVRLGRAAVPDVDVYSSLTLNTFVGGLNPSAVELAVETGASVVWLPTFSAANFETDRPYPFRGQTLTVTDDAGDLRPELLEILDVLDDADRRLVLGNGHVSPAETDAVLDAIDERGTDVDYLVTHPDSAFMGLSLADQIDLANRGAYVEKCYLPVVKGDVTIEAMAEGIAEIGAERCVLSTDHGQPTNQSPPDAYAAFVERLRRHGVSASAVERMSRTVPCALLGEPR
jgi:hypothetical protein